MIRLITTTDADTTAATTVILTADDLESIATHRQTLQLYSIDTGDRPATAAVTMTTGQKR